MWLDDPQFKGKDRTRQILSYEAVYDYIGEEFLDEVDDTRLIQFKEDRAEGVQFPFAASAGEVIGAGLFEGFFGEGFLFLVHVYMYCTARAKADYGLTSCFPVPRATSFPQTLHRCSQLFAWHDSCRLW